jgi:hypothetical protein
VDNRKLNDITKKDCFLFPWIEDTLHMLAGMVLHSGPEEQLLADGPASIQPGEDYDLNGSGAMAVHCHAL